MVSVSLSPSSLGGAQSQLQSSVSAAQLQSNRPFLNGFKSEFTPSATFGQHSFGTHPAAAYATPWAHSATNPFMAAAAAAALSSSSCSSSTALGEGKQRAWIGLTHTTITENGQQHEKVAATLGNGVNLGQIGWTGAAQAAYVPTAYYAYGMGTQCWAGNNDWAGNATITQSAEESTKGSTQSVPVKADKGEKMDEQKGGTRESVADETKQQQNGNGTNPPAFLAANGTEYGGSFVRTVFRCWKPLNLPVGPLGGNQSAMHWGGGRRTSGRKLVNQCNPVMQQTTAGDSGGNIKGTCAGRKLDRTRRGGRGAGWFVCCVIRGKCLSSFPPFLINQRPKYRSPSPLRVDSLTPHNPITPN